MFCAVDPDLSPLCRSGDSSLTGPGSVKDAWKEISSALHENSASSSYTPFTVCNKTVGMAEPKTL